MNKQYNTWMKSLILFIALSNASCSDLATVWNTPVPVPSYSCGGSDLDDQLWRLDQHVQDLDWDVREAQ